MPDISFKAQVFLPQEHIKWLVTLPESVLSVHKVREEKHALRYLNNKSVNNSADAKVTVKFIDDIIGRCLTKQLYRIQADMYDEIRASVDEAMGTSEKWHEVNLGQTMETVAERTGSRALFGMTVCRNREYLHNMSAWNMLMGLGVLTVGQAPRLARPFIATMINLPLRVYKARVMRILVPFIQTRMQDFERGKRGGSPNDASNDFATQAVKVALGRKDHTVFEDPNVLAEQFILLVSFCHPTIPGRSFIAHEQAFAALSTTSVMGTNVFVDILNTDPDHDVYSTLRDEAAHAFPSEADWSDPAALSKLVLINSAVRETLRTVPMAPRGLLREVLPEAGLTLPEGKQVPRGTWVGAPIQAIHMDDRFYDRPARYDPFRFARTESESDAPDASQTSDTFLSWGHGRSAWSVPFVLFFCCLLKFDSIC